MWHITWGKGKQKEKHSKDAPKYNTHFRQSTEGASTHSRQGRNDEPTHSRLSTEGDLTSTYSRQGRNDEPTHSRLSTEGDLTSTYSRQGRNNEPTHSRINTKGDLTSTYSRQGRNNEPTHSRLSTEGDLTSTYCRQGRNNEPTHSRINTKDDLTSTYSRQGRNDEPTHSRINTKDDLTSTYSRQGRNDEPTHSRISTKDDLTSTYSRQGRNDEPTHSRINTKDDLTSTYSRQGRNNEPTHSRINTKDDLTSTYSRQGRNDEPTHSRISTKDDLTSTYSRQGRNDEPTHSRINTKDDLTSTYSRQGRNDEPTHSRISTKDDLTSKYSRQGRNNEPTHSRLSTEDDLISKYSRQGRNDEPTHSRINTKDDLTSTYSRQGRNDEPTHSRISTKDDLTSTYSRQGRNNEPTHSRMSTEDDLISTYSRQGRKDEPTHSRISTKDDLKSTYSRQGRNNEPTHSRINTKDDLTSTYSRQGRNDEPTHSRISTKDDFTSTYSRQGRNDEPTHSRLSTEDDLTSTYSRQSRNDEPTHSRISTKGDLISTYSRQGRNDEPTHSRLSTEDDLTSTYSRQSRNDEPTHSRISTKGDLISTYSRQGRNDEPTHSRLSTEDDLTSTYSRQSRNDEPTHSRISVKDDLTSTYSRQGRNNKPTHSRLSTEDDLTSTDSRQGRNDEPSNSRTSTEDDLNQPWMSSEHASIYSRQGRNDELTYSSKKNLLIYSLQGGNETVKKQGQSREDIQISFQQKGGETMNSGDTQKHQITTDEFLQPEQSSGYIKNIGQGIGDKLTHPKQNSGDMKNQDLSFGGESIQLEQKNQEAFTHHRQGSEKTKYGHCISTEIKSKEEESRLKLIEDLLSRLGLEENFDKKLTRADFLDLTSASLQNEEPKNEKDLVHAYIKQLLSTNYRARHTYLKAEPTKPKPQCEVSQGPFEALFKKNNVTKEKKQSHIHPMDIQIAVFLCADNFLRQILVTKLSQCQYAVPLLVPSPSSRKIEFPLWTVRQISKYWKTIDSSGEVISKNQFMYKAETPMVAFFRLGYISSSKSQIINNLISEKHHTFFHRNCPGSSRDRLLMDGVVEIAWYLPSGKNTDHFTDCVAFCNLHGDSSTNETQRKILTEMASVNVVLLPTYEENDNNMVIVKELRKSATPLIVLLTDEEDDEDDVSVIGKRKYKVRLKGRNQSNISSTLRSVIRNCLSHQSLTFRLENVAKYTELLLDENDEACQKAKASAQKIMRFLEKEDPSTIKEKYLPCHGKLWIDWCNMDKDLQHLQSNNIEAEKSTKQQEMRELRIQQQKHGVSVLMNSFIESLNSQSDTEKLYFIKWIANLLDVFTSEKIFTIHQEYNKKWEQVLTLKNTQSALTGIKADQLKAEQSNLEKISSKLNSATLGLEHILREMGQIYEASASEKREMQRNQTGKLSYLPGLAAELMISGHPMELMDGDAAHVPLIWISAVLDELINKLGDQRVFVLSVLGIQSTGKSTMLNAMFGLQFAVSAGRCTRGAFMQLVKVSEEMKKELKTDYILVVDTEGLRAMELAGKDTIRHDNELSTFVVGIANMTLINIFGENHAEMQDILQIVVQAFMRMKQVKLNPSCIFVHQNITDVAAGSKMIEGRRRLQENLDEMTQLAAEDAGFDAECFSDVIAFDVQNDVKYFSQLWEGNPPMAPPNPNYSENIQDLKRVIISRASKIPRMKFSQFRIQVLSLWDALLNENFVFSFINLHKRLLYRNLEEECEKWTLSLRKSMLRIEEKMTNKIACGKVETVEKRELRKEMEEVLQDVKKAFKVYFEENSEKETLNQWKCKFEKQIQNIHDDLIDEAKRKLEKVETEWVV